MKFNSKLEARFLNIMHTAPNAFFVNHSRLIAVNTAVTASNNSGYTFFAAFAYLNVYIHMLCHEDIIATNDIVREVDSMHLLACKNDGESYTH